MSNDTKKLSPLAELDVPREQFGAVAALLVVQTLRNNGVSLLQVMGEGEDTFIAYATKAMGHCGLTHHEWRRVFATICQEVEKEAARRGALIMEPQRG